MTIRIGHASIDEKRQAKGGAAGDQTGREVCIRPWYAKPWTFVLRCKDPEKAEAMAKACEAGCANPNIGYDQNQRNTLNTQARKVNYDLHKISEPCETDCSAFMTVCAQAAGIPVPYHGTNAPTTSSMKRDFLNTGMFEAFTASKYLTDDSYLKRGDILVKPGSHTVMVLDNGKNAACEEAVNASAKNIIKAGQQHASAFTGIKISADGIAGPETARMKSRVLQHAVNMDYHTQIAEDGAFGSASKKALGTHYVKRGEKQFLVTAAEILLMLNGVNPDGVEYPGIYGCGLVNAAKKKFGGEGLLITSSDFLSLL